MHRCGTAGAGLGGGDKFCIPDPVRTYTGQIDMSWKQFPTQGAGITADKRFGSGIYI